MRRFRFTLVTTREAAIGRRLRRRSTSTSSSSFLPSLPPTHHLKTSQGKASKETWPQVCGRQVLRRAPGEFAGAFVKCDYEEESSE